MLLGVIAVYQMAGAAQSSGAELTGNSITVGRGTLSVTVLATGRVEPALQAQIRSRVGGVVSEVLVTEGQAVAQGDVLLKLDPVDYQREVERLDAEVSQRRAELRLARQRLRTLRRGLEQRVVPAVELDAVRADLSLARARLNATLVSRRSAEDRVQYATLVAPFAGTIISRNVQPGEMVVPTATIEGRPLLALGDTGTLIVRTELNQVDFAPGEAGQSRPGNLRRPLRRRLRGRAHRPARVVAQGVERHGGLSHPAAAEAVARSGCGQTGDERRSGDRARDQA